MSTQLHGFCDASQLAYTGVVYCRTVYTDTSTTISLVTPKTKVAHLNTLTIPQLELCGAQLLSKLLLSMMDTLAIPIQDVHAWCDSTITLGWLNTSPQKLKTFVSNSLRHSQTSSLCSLALRENRRQSCRRCLPGSDSERTHPQRTMVVWTTLVVSISRRMAYLSRPLLSHRTARIQDSRSSRQASQGRLLRPILVLSTTAPSSGLVPEIHSKLQRSYR